MAYTDKECIVDTKIDCKVESKPYVLAKLKKGCIFRVTVSHKRNASFTDTFYLDYPSKLQAYIKEGDFIHVTGDIRTFNKKNTDKVLESSIFAKTIDKLDCEPEVYENETIITNAELRKFIGVRPSYTNLDLIVAEYQLRLDRGYGRISYFDAESWNNTATYISRKHEAMHYINIRGKLKSSISKTSNRLYMSLTVNRIDINE
jgi:hypothetical protein